MHPLSIFVLICVEILFGLNIVLHHNFTFQIIPILELSTFVFSFLFLQKFLQKLHKISK